jgi:hypothetical protein
MTVNFQNSRRILTAKSVFNVSLIVAGLTILNVWFFGLGQHRTLFENSILSVSVLAIFFFLFLTLNLYRGVKVKDDFGKIKDKINFSEMNDFSSIHFKGDIPDVDAGEGIAGIIISLILWIAVTFLLAFFLWFFGVVFWTAIIVFMAMLYWIYLRALQLVFRNANQCKGDFIKSALYGFGYTLLYSSWIYMLIIGMNYL